MPELISVQDFISQTQEDLSSPTTSSFTSHMGKCKSTVGSLEEALDLDRVVLQKIRKAVKAEHATGQDLIGHLEAHIAAQEKFSGNYQNNGEEKLAEAFSSFASFSRELLEAVKSMLLSLYHNINFALDSLIKGDFKGDFKKPFEKAWKDYESKLTKIEKEKRELAKQYGMVRTEVVGGEIAEEMEKERRMFQLQMCEYLIKVNEIKTKKGVDLLQNNINHCNSQFNFFQTCLKATEKHKHFIENLTPELQIMKAKQEEEKKQLYSLRDQLKTSLQLEPKENTISKPLSYSMHQLQGNKQYGTEKSGTLLKKSDGLRRIWQKRKCTVKNGYLTISHSTQHRPPVKLNLLTCQVKPNVDDRKCFDLISHNRTYHFLAEDEQEGTIWVSVLSNSKEEALNVAFQQAQGREGCSMEDLTAAIIREIKHMPGNGMCCDCLASDPAWLSINLGILICIECSGIHREMGVHHSRIQSLALDKLATSELLLAKNIGNSRFNDIVEANLPKSYPKPDADSTMTLRKDFIISKYVEKKYVARRMMGSPADRLRGLQKAVRERDIFVLLQAYAEKVDLSEPLLEFSQEPGETLLHLAILECDRTSLHIVDFLVQNSGSLMKQTSKGNTPLHYCSLHNKHECIKLLLRAKASIEITNQAGEMVLDVARRMKHSVCENLLLQAQNNQFNMRAHVEYEWQLGQDDMFESDDDLDEKLSPIKKDRFNRPQSCYNLPGTASQSWRNPADFSKGASPAFQEKSHDLYAKPHASRLAAAAASSPVSACTGPPLPARNTPRAPSFPPPPPPSSWPVFPADMAPRKILPPPPVMRHKRTSSEPPSNALLNDTSPTQDSRCFSLPRNCSPEGTSPSSLSSESSGLSEAVQSWEPAVTRKTSMPWFEPSQNPRENHWASSHSLEPPDDVPPPLPARGNRKSPLLRVKALYNCEADHEDELTFFAGEVIIVDGEEDSSWWFGRIEGQPHRKGLFPSSFVYKLNE
ncbi:arf-GAP with SH3 domain, ANK repeat and PH domain-containing protein 2-like isoform X2 [Varanus komodoensis]|uniref:arf-GAP with SH3 domain, ANK repeat and PH domain-containing protein 2-like isoform X2 n=1 Tax=Varanus komodoensis TaxID=61221 RepID=UPI001CF789B0|nr:arf-GAP with SH3 domain, ANK repeat and PH domain-containing protein 2-like isoform X2 [Varanus komodoensis]